MKALEKDRNRRYASPTAFVDDIERDLCQDVVLRGHRRRRIDFGSLFGVTVLGCCYFFPLS